MIAEGARDYWSLQNRNGKIYDILGDLDNIKIRHKKGIICLQPCGENTLLVALTKMNKVNWNDWMEKTKHLDKYYELLEKENNQSLTKITRQLNKRD